MSNLNYNVTKYDYQMTYICEKSEEEVERPEPVPMPEPEPLVGKNKMEEIFVLPAGHGLRYKFKIEDLNYYNPEFGFMSE